MKFKMENVGQRVQLKRDAELGFKAGDIGTIKSTIDLAGDDAYVVHFDIARDGWASESLGIPDLHGLYVNPEDLRKVKE